MLHIYTLCGNLLVWQEIRQNKLDGYDQSIMNYQQWQTSEDSGRIEKVKLEETVTYILDTINTKLEHFLFHDFLKNSQILVIQR